MKSLWVPLSGAIAQQRNVETIANNVANANTPGFKKDQLVFKEYMTVLDKGYGDIDLPNKEWAPKDFYKSYGAENAQVKVDGSFTIHEQGQLTPTGNPFDLALQGKGFIEVLTPNGSRYTRRGTLSLNPDGVLVTDQGNPVLSQLDPNLLKQADGREPANLPKPQDRIIKLDQGKMSVNLQGDLFINNQPVSKLSVVEFKDIHALRKEGNSLFINNNNQNIKTEGLTTAIHQGFVEQSNVNPVHEMSELIKANRQFESIQRVIKAYDSIAGKSVNEIAKF